MMCFLTVLVRQFVHRSLLELSSPYPYGMHLKLMNTAFQNLFIVHKANLNTIKRCLLTNYSPSSPDPDFRDCSIQVVVRASWGMTKRLQQTFPRQELTVGHT